MTAARPHRARSRPASPMRARRQLSQRPRRWGRPLTVGLALALVAVLMPGAHAEGEGDGGGLPVAAEGLGDEASFQTSVAETMAETLEGQPPAPSPEGADGSGEVGGDRVALADGGGATGGGGLSPERLQPDPVPLEGAQQRQA